jgi:hypothetical protein
MPIFATSWVRLVMMMNPFLASFDGQLVCMFFECIITVLIPPYATEDINLPEDNHLKGGIALVKGVSGVKLRQLSDCIPWVKDVSTVFDSTTDANDKQPRKKTPKSQSSHANSSHQSSHANSSRQPSHVAASPPDTPRQHRERSAPTLTTLPPKKRQHRTSEEQSDEDRRAVARMSFAMDEPLATDYASVRGRRGIPHGDREHRQRVSQAEETFHVGQALRETVPMRWDDAEPTRSGIRRPLVGPGIGHHRPSQIHRSSRASHTNYDFPAGTRYPWHSFPHATAQMDPGWRENWDDTRDVSYPQPSSQSQGLSQYDRRQLVENVTGRGRGQPFRGYHGQPQQRRYQYGFDDPVPDHLGDGEYMDYTTENGDVFGT